MKRVQQGFTLIELMIVIAIVGILAAVALPAYRDYTLKARNAETMAMGSAAQALVAEFSSINKALPTSIETASPPAGSHVKSVTWTSPSLVILTKTEAEGAQNEIADKTIVLTASMGSDGQISWSCGPGATKPMPTKYLPATCQTAAAST